MIPAYCTNVHAAEDLPGVVEQLDHYAVRVRDDLGVDTPARVRKMLSRQYCDGARPAATGRTGF
ncbi:hypothetical protein ACRAKI_12855 [Saccharothrix isguenensis]